MNTKAIAMNKKCITIVKNVIRTFDGGLVDLDDKLGVDLLAKAIVKRLKVSKMLKTYEPCGY